MHILGILFLVLMAGAFTCQGDRVGAWLFDRRNRSEL